MLQSLIEELRIHAAFLGERRAIPVDPKLVQQLSRDILRELPRHLKFRKMGDPMWLNRGYSPKWGFELERTLKLKSVMGQLVHVTVSVGAKRMDDNEFRSFVAGGAAKGYYRADIKRKPVGHKQFPQLVVNFNEQRSPQEFLDNMKGKVRKELESVLEHELTHLQDVINPHEYDPTLMDPDEKDLEAYYNDPAELRAFGRQIASEVKAFTHSKGTEDSFNVLLLNAAFVERALRSSPTWNRISEHLRPKSEKLIRRIAVTALRDEWPEIQRLYPDTDED